MRVVTCPCARIGVGSSCSLSPQATHTMEAHAVLCYFPVCAEGWMARSDAARATKLALPIPPRLSAEMTVMCCGMLFGGVCVGLL